MLKNFLYCGLLATFVMPADSSLRAETPSVVDITVLPAEVRLHGLRDKQQLLVSGAFSGTAAGAAADLTVEATFECLTPSVAVVSSGGLVVPRGNGTAQVVVRLGGFEKQISVTVGDVGRFEPIDFEIEAIAALSKAGCNQGSCHGSPQGKNGFRLSLRGFDPALDFASLVRDQYGRRTNPQNADDSLILKKGLGQVPHQGGTRFKSIDAAYQALRMWVDQGCRPSAAPRKLVRLEVLPGRRRLPESHPRQQLVAVAHFDDGTVRDVSDLAVFTSGNEETAGITADGIVEFHHTGEVSFLVRYLDKITGVRMSYVRRDPQFTFTAPQPANEVDLLVFAKQQELQIRPAEPATDEVFLRRVYLDVIGTPPTAEEARQFLDSAETDKRERLIDRLLERDEFATFWALKWADLMRGSDVTISRRGVFAFHRYLVQMIREDRPFDQFARETLTGSGNTLHNPAANFFRVARTPDEMAEAAAQLFLGVRIGCAKCHNHPFESITQSDYYGLAAYFARVKFKGNEFGLDDEIVYLDRRGDVRHPVGNQIVAPASFGQPAGELTPDDDPRERLVDWLTQPDNPYFARSIVNRVWFHLFGTGIVEPVDDFRDTNPPSNPELLDRLAADFVQHGYRIKPVLRQILNSRTYQLSSRPVEQSPHAADTGRYFSHAAVKMLSGEQILDAISQATGVPAQFDGYPPGTRAIELAEGNVEHPFLQAFSKPVRDTTCECARDGDPSISQIIHLLNNPDVLSGIRSDESRIGRWLRAGHSDAEITELLYLGTLSRRPTAAERELVAKYLATVEGRDAGFHDVQHALLNSNEFLLRH